PESRHGPPDSRPVGPQPARGDARRPRRVPRCADRRGAATEARRRVRNDVTEPVGLAAVIRRSTAYLERQGVESPAASVETLLMHLLDIDRAGLYARRDRLDTATAKAFGRALCQRCTGVPLQHLTGEQPFLGLRLRVEPGVFVPRPETEVLALHAIELLDGIERPTVVDVGTGTGA